MEGRKEGRKKRKQKNNRSLESRVYVCWKRLLTPNLKEVDSVTSGREMKVISENFLGILNRCR